VKSGAGLPTIELPQPTKSVTQAMTKQAPRILFMIASPVGNTRK
jgi:hypothetical protein